MTARTKTDSHESAAVSVATKTFRVLVFGKVGCDKCAMLNRRLDRLFAEESWQDFEKQYCDIETEEGLIAFCRAQCVNPSRIPALLVTRRQADGSYAPLPSRDPGAAGDDSARSRLYQFLGLQTDYSDAGHGLITPAMIEAVLQEARGAS